MHSERRHFVLLCGDAARWRNPSLLSAIAGGYGIMLHRQKRQSEKKKMEQCKGEVQSISPTLHQKKANMDCHMNLPALIRIF